MKEIYKALANFQQEIGTLPKDASGYGYKYTELSTIVEKALPLLKKHGLGFTQPMSGTAVKTILFHAESGESIESSLDIPQGVELKGMNEYQALGSAITYLRRYSLASILGIVTDEDTDAQGEQTEKRAYKPSTDDKPTNTQLSISWLILYNDIFYSLISLFSSSVIDRSTFFCHSRSFVSFLLKASLFLALN